jgi:hypothetical protein
MNTHFTCPHCGQRTSTSRTDFEAVDLGNGCPVSLFPSLPPGEERHLDQRLCCPSCYEAHGRHRARGEAVNPTDPPHPFGSRFHREVRLAHPVGRKL